ncbi:MAG: hypothetical protein IT583_01475 [Verrucomicrobia bacterium]|nr:hypothetical protein [Verrucomicrobiota bacterium]
MERAAYASPGNGSVTKWAVTSLGKNVPWHFSAYRPTTQWNKAPATPLQTLLEAKHIAA